MNGKLSLLFGCTLMFFLAGQAQASTWLTVANMGSGTEGDPASELESLYSISISTNPPQIYGPFLSEELVNTDADVLQYGEKVFDIVQIPHSNNILISNFGGKRINLVNLTNPQNPEFVDFLTLETTEQVYPAGFAAESQGTATTSYSTVTAKPFDRSSQSKQTQQNLSPVTTATTTTTSMSAEDIAVSSDGSFAIVSDGGFTDIVAFLDLHTFTLKKLFPLYEGVPFDVTDPPSTLPDLFYANAVAITPDNQTALFADYSQGRLVYGKINSSHDGLEEVKSIVLCPNPEDDGTCPAYEYKMAPLNVTISPDGQTAIVVGAFQSVIAIFKITGAGEVEKGTPFQLWGLPDSYSDYLIAENYDGEPYHAAAQSAVFSPDGTKAYLFQSSTSQYQWDGSSWVNTTTTVQDENGDDVEVDATSDKISWIQITGPGQAEVGGVWVADLPSNQSGQLFGVDTLTISPDGKYLFTSNTGTSEPQKDVARINTTTFAVDLLNVDSKYPSGLNTFIPYFPWPSFMPAIINGKRQP